MKGNNKHTFSFFSVVTITVLILIDCSHYDNWEGRDRREQKGTEGIRRRGKGREGVSRLYQGWAKRRTEFVASKKDDEQSLPFRQSSYYICLSSFSSFFFPLFHLSLDPHIHWISFHPDSMKDHIRELFIVTDRQLPSFDTEWKCLLEIYIQLDRG